MLIPPQFRQLEPRQSPDNNHLNNPAENSYNSSQDGSNGQNKVVIVISAVVVFVVAFLVIVYFVLRSLRRMECRPRYIPGKFLKDRWTRWNVGASYGQVPGGSSSNQAGLAENQTTVQNPQTDSTAGIRRDTSIRSIITLPAYSSTPKPTEQVIAREGEREGMDVVVEFPETADEEEARREELMESLYQIRLQRRQEIAEREARRRERREARERGDLIRLEQLRAERREQANSRESPNGSTTNAPAAVALAEAQSRGRERRISSVTYADVGYVRHDGSRIRASSRDSDSRPLLTDAAAISGEGPDRSSGLTSLHSRGESYSSALSLARGSYESDSLANIQSHHASTPSLTPPSAEDGDVGASNIPPPDYDHLDWGEAPPYEHPPTDSSNENPPRSRDLTRLPTIQIDVVSPDSNSPVTPTITQLEEQQQGEQRREEQGREQQGAERPAEEPREGQQTHESPLDTSSQNNPHSPEVTQVQETPVGSSLQDNNNASPAARTV